MRTDHITTLLGRPLPGCSFTIDPEEHDRFCSALGMPRPEVDAINPAFAYAVAQRGMGIDVAGMFRLAGWNDDAKPMLASCEIRLTTPLEPAVSYDVDGEIVSLQRKLGKAGAFELLRVRQDLWTGERLPVGSVANVFALPLGAA